MIARARYAFPRGSVGTSKNALLQSVPGIGSIAAASLIGVATVTKESRRYKGKRVIQGGRAQVRTVLYMAMMSAMQCNLVFKATYTRLVAAGKPKKSPLLPVCVRWW
jgi:Transposase IS116/IS110/IS902 family.